MRVQIRENNKKIKKKYFFLLYKELLPQIAQSLIFSIFRIKIKLNFKNKIDLSFIWFNKVEWFLNYYEKKKLILFI